MHLRDIKHTTRLLKVYTWLLDVVFYLPAAKIKQSRKHPFTRDETVGGEKTH